MNRTVYTFGGGVSHDDPRAKDKTVTGGKGANLAEMAGIGLPVPPGFTITTEECLAYNAGGRTLRVELKDEIAKGIAHIEQATGCRFGQSGHGPGSGIPLLVSVRSGARVSMPGMMDTVLNLGLDEAAVESLAASSGDPRFAWDSYRRFIQMYADVVMGADHGLFEEALEIAKEDRGVSLDTDLGDRDLWDLSRRYKAIVREETGRDFPDDPWEQLHGAVAAVFDSWESDRARVYRRLNDIPADWGTAVNVQAMVFGNMGETSATGVAFTRDPATGERAYYGEWLVNAQGEDVVAGIRTPQYLTRAAREKAGASAPSMEEAMPEAYAELARVFDLLERHYRDMQDIEFTVQQGKLWMLQTRSGKRTARAALRMAVEMVGEGLIDEKTAVLRVDPMALDQLLHPTLDPKAPRDVLTRGLPASPGAASGRIVLDADTAEDWRGRGEKVLLVRVETSPEDIHGMHAAQGVLTARGGMTSHAAVVARGMGRPCVSGASDVSIDLPNRRLRIGARELAEGDLLTIDGATGEVMVGEVPTIEPELAGDFGTLMVWADRHRRMKVRTNAETPADCRMARQFGAEGIGLCRTEHMFFDAARISAVREMILAESEAGRRAALAKLLPEQRADFTEIFRTMAGLPCTIRLLDPPLHEFLPQHEAEFAELAEVTGFDVARLKRRADELHEFNPMLGHRGCRLGITFPEIYEMQARAIFEAACDVAAEQVLRQAQDERGMDGSRAKDASREKDASRAKDASREKDASQTPSAHPELVEGCHPDLVEGCHPELVEGYHAVVPEVMIPLVGTRKELAILRKLVDDTAATVFAEKGRTLDYLVGTMIELPRAALMAGEIAEEARFFSFGTNDLTQTVLGVSRDDASRFLSVYVDKGIYPRDPFVSLDVEGVGQLITLAAERGRAVRPDIKLGICGEHGGDPASIAFCEATGLDYVSASPYRVPIARLAAAQAALRADPSTSSG